MTSSEKLLQHSHVDTTPQKIRGGFEQHVFSIEERQSIKQEVLDTANDPSSKFYIPALQGIPSEEIDRQLNNDLALIEKFEQVARGMHFNPVNGEITGHHPNIYPDTDIVMIISGPGEYSLSFPPYNQKPDYQYHEYKWSRKMDRSRLRTGVALIHIITALRCKKNLPKLHRMIYENMDRGFTMEQQHGKTIISAEYTAEAVKALNVALAY